MRVVSIVLFAAAVQGAAAAAACPLVGSGIFTFLRTVGSSTLYFPLEQLCQPEEDYKYYILGTNHNYSFNIGAYASTPCNPVWGAFYANGYAIQSWDQAPPCSQPSCMDPVTGKLVCCTPQCEIIAFYEPVFSLSDPSNPKTGGISLSYFGAPNPGPYSCPVNPISGGPTLHNFILNIACDPTLGRDELVVTEVVEQPVGGCTYVANTRSGAGCASSTPQPAC